MKLFVWCFVVLSSFFMGMFVMAAFHLPSAPDETYKQGAKEINVGNVSSKASALEIEDNSASKSEHFNVSLTKALEAYQACYPNKSITSVVIDKTFGPYYYEIKGRDEKKEYNLRISTKAVNVKKKQVKDLQKNEQTTAAWQEEALNIKKLKNFSEITKISEQQIIKGNIVKWQLAKKKDQAVWTVTLRKDAQTFDIQIDAYTGKVLAVLTNS